MRYLALLLLSLAGCRAMLVSAHCSNMGQYPANHPWVQACLDRYREPPPSAVASGPIACHVAEDCPAGQYCEGGDDSNLGTCLR